MTQCGYSHFPDPWEDDPDDKAWSCQEEAKFTCCDYGGRVCEKHKCRCSRPLPPSGRPEDTLGQKSWLCWCGKPSRLKNRHSWCATEGCEPLSDERVAELAAFERDLLKKDLL